MGQPCSSVDAFDACDCHAELPGGRGLHLHWRVDVDPVTGAAVAWAPGDFDPPFAELAAVDVRARVAGGPVPTRRAA